MFDDLSSLESRTESTKEISEGEAEPSRERMRWSGLIGGGVFLVLYLLFRSHPWGWPVAIAVSYTTAAFAIALTSALKYADDFFGDVCIPKYVAQLLLPHILILLPVTFAAWLWLRAVPLLPHWMTVEGRYPSLWEYCGIVAAAYAAVSEGDWLAAKIKRRSAEPED